MNFYALLCYVASVIAGGLGIFYLIINAPSVEPMAYIACGVAFLALARTWMNDDN